MERLTTNIIPPDGPLGAKILLIGEAPGEEENYLLKPFVGSAGNLLDRCLKAAGLERKFILVRNVFSQHPPGNNVGHFYQDKGKKILTAEGQEHLEDLRRWLLRLLEQRETTGEGPNVIGALGAEPLKHLCGKQGILKWRGSCLPCTLVPGFKVYPITHPSYVNRLMNEPEERTQGQKKKDKINALPTFIKDLERLKAQSLSPDLPVIKEEFTIIKSLTEGIQRLQELHKKGNIVAIDIETLRHVSGPLVWCIGFSDSPERGFCIPILEKLKFVWTVNEEAALWQEISKLFLNPNVLKLFHNAGFDLSILGRFYGLRLADGTLGDTMVGTFMNYPYLRKSLAYATSIYTWRPYYKDEGKVHATGGNDYQEFIYNIRDCSATREIYPVIRQDARELGTEHNYSFSMKVFPAQLYKMIKGVKIDIKKRDTLAQELPMRASTSENSIKAIIGRDINLRSHVQVKDLLYISLDCEPRYNHKTGKLSSDKDAVNSLVKKYNNPSDLRFQVLTNLTEFRKISKLADTYSNFQLDPDGRIRTSYGWVSTFRLSSSESHFGGGGNLQNIPVRSEEGKDIRRLFIPDEGLELGAADLSQAEAREVAWLAGDRKLMDLFLAGEDVHWANAMEIFGFDPKTSYEKEGELSDRYTGDRHPMKFYRNLAKTIVHARNYRMGPMMLQLILMREGVSLSQRACTQLLASSRANSPMITKWQERTIDEVKTTRRLTTALGDVREFRGRLDDGAFRSAIAFHPQSVVGRILQFAEQIIHEELTELCDILLNVHDEVVWQNDPENRNLLIPLIKERMEYPHEINGRELIIPCDFKFGPNWGDMKEVKI